MDEKLARLQRLVATRYSDSVLTPMSETEIGALQHAFPGVPRHLLDFYQAIGTGRIGSSRYMIHGLLSPSDVYDAETSASLTSVLIVGDG